MIQSIRHIESLGKIFELSNKDYISQRGNITQRRLRDNILWLNRGKWVNKEHNNYSIELK